MVLGVYTLIFGIGLPVMVARWWKQAKVLSKTQILTESMSTFYKDLRDGMSVLEVLFVLAKSEEFAQVQMDEDSSLWKNLEKDIEKALIGEKTFDLKLIKKVIESLIEGVQRKREESYLAPSFTSPPTRISFVRYWYHYSTNI